MDCHNLWPVFIRPIGTWAWPKLVLVAGGLAFAAPSPTPVKPFTAYHDGDAIVFTPEMTGTRRLATFGPWNLGERLTNGELVDKRLNLYIVVPGTQYRSPQHPQYDHNRIVNKYTADGRVHDWDIFYCFVIDPKLADDFRSEGDLLIAAHQTFHPPDRFNLNDMPSGRMVEQKLGLHSMADVWKYHRKNHALPRMLIVPAHLAVRATAELPDVTITHPAAVPER
jgi:hypothetical protein